MHTDMYRVLIVGILCRIAFGASTTPRTTTGSFEQDDWDIDGAIVNDGSTGKGETNVNKYQNQLNNEKGKETSGHGSEEFKLQEEQKAYDGWLLECASMDEIPEIPAPVKLYLELINLSEDELVTKCNAMKNQTRRRGKRLFEEARGVWDKCIIPYKFDDSLGLNARRTVLKVQNVFHQNTGFWFVEFNNANTDLGLDHNNYLIYMKGTGCWSGVGNGGGNGQNISPCSTFGNALHEIGHALGAAHEQNNPAALTLMKPNFDNMPEDNSYGTWSTGWLSPRMKQYYDMTSIMHYGNNQPLKGYGPKLNIDEPELTKVIAFGDYFLFFRDLQIFNKCYDTFSCSPLPTCEMGGYPSIVDGVCTCACPEGLDPATKCSSIKALSTTSLSELEGTSSILKVKGSSCPKDFSPGQMALWNSDSVGEAGEFLSEGLKGAYELVFDVCTQTTSSGSKPWPKGDYCILKRAACPSGFEEGLLETRGKVPERENANVGALPDGIKGQDFEFEFCCRYDWPYKAPTRFPNRESFILYQFNENGCQQVEGMSVTKGSYQTKSDTSSGALSYTGTLPYYEENGPGDITMHYCVYIPQNTDGQCGEVKQFSSDETTFSFTSPNYPSNYAKNKECLWHFESPEGTTMKIEFSDFEVSTVNDDKCQSHIELKTVHPGMTGYRICGHYEKKSRLSVSNLLTVKFVSSYNTPQKGFKATVTVLKESDQCYPEDGKYAYSGTINYSRGMMPCLPWSEVKNCALNQFTSSVMSLDLSHNYCRTVNTGRMPWCYINKEMCTIENCDVCMRDSCYDLLPNCAAIVQKDGEFCAKNDLGEAEKRCKQTCGFCDKHKQTPAYSTVTCPAPGDVTNISPSPTKTTYVVGDEVSYACPDTKVVRKRTCQSDGTWNHLGYVCSACRDGWTYISGYCHQWQEGAIKTNSEAKEMCKNLDSSLPAVTSDEHFNRIMGLQYNDKLNNYEVWLPIYKTDSEWKWEAGIDSSYYSWEKDHKKHYPCVVGKGPNTMKTTWHGWKYEVICSYKHTDTLVCEDDLLNCIDILKTDPNMCEAYPDYAWVNCRKTCGVPGCAGSNTCSVTNVQNAKQVQGPSNSAKPGQLVPSCSYEVCEENRRHIVNANVLEMIVSRLRRRQKRHHEFVEYDCNDGYLLKSGDLKRTCLSSGEFLGDLPICAKASEVDRVTLFTDVELYRRDYFDSSYMGYSETANIDTTRIKIAGKITAWTFFASQAGELTMQVWRPNSQNAAKFTFIGKNTLTVTADNRAVSMDVNPEDQIAVQKGDTIGFVMSVPVLTYSSCKTSALPQYSPWMTTTWRIPLSELTRGKVITLKKYSLDCRIYSIHVTIKPSA